MQVIFTENTINPILGHVETSQLKNQSSVRRDIDTEYIFVIILNIL